MSDRSGSDWRGFLGSRAGVILLAFMAVAGFFLIYEHRAHIFSGNGILVGLLALCVVMHLFMHHGHGGHGDSGGHGSGAEDPREDDR